MAAELRSNSIRLTISRQPSVFHSEADILFELVALGSRSKDNFFKRSIFVGHQAGFIFAFEFVCQLPEIALPNK